MNLDEGWYLWASKLVYANQQLYRDFAYTQTPLLPYIYGIFQSIFGQGIYQGRILSAMLGMATGLLSAWIVYCLVRATFKHDTDSEQKAIATRASLFCLLLFATSFYAICYFVYSATYSLAAFFLVCSVGALVLFPAADQSTARKLTRYALSTIFISLAIATRMSAVGALPALLLYLIATNLPTSNLPDSDLPDINNATARILTRADLARVILTIAVTGIAAAVILLGPFWLLSGELMYYNIFGFHTDRIPSIERQWYRQLTTLRRSGWIYAVPLVLTLIVSCSGIINSGSRNLGSRNLGSRNLGSGNSGSRSSGARQQRPESERGWRFWFRRNGFELLLGGMILGPLVLHLIPRTTDVYYNTLQFPLLCMMVSLLVARLWTPAQNKTPLLRSSRYLLSGLLLLNCVIHLIALRQFDLIEWDRSRFLPVNQIEIVKDAADFLDQADKRDNQLLTLNTHLALEANMDVPHGYEMSIFSYRPDWNDADSQRYHVVNNEMLIADLQEGVDAVAITDFDAERFYGKRQQIFDTLTQNYRHAKTIPNFDPQHGNLNIYLPPQFGEPLPQYAFVVNSYPCPDQPCITFQKAETATTELDRAGQNLSGEGDDSRSPEKDAERNREKEGEEDSEQISLLGYDLATSRDSTEDYRAGDIVEITLYWQAHQPVSQPYTSFVQVLNSAGALVVGKDNPPCQRTCPTQSWQPNEVLRDEYRIELPDILESGQYIVQIGLYHSETLEPLKMFFSPVLLDPATLDKNLIGEFVDNRLRLTKIKVQ